MKTGVGAREIEKELRSIATVISSPTRLTLFGGCCMSVRGLKVATKDTDVVVEGPQIQQLLDDIENAGYHPVEDKWSIYFDGYVIVTNSSGIRIDLFPPTRIFDSPGFTQSMQQHSEHWFTSGDLRVDLADPTAIFLFKSLTGRWRSEPERDIEDLRRLLARGFVDWDRLYRYWGEFTEKSDKVTEKAQESVSILRNQGLSVPWDP